MQVFFCKYNDPIYVKMEKLEIMIRLASDRNIDQVSGRLTRVACLPASLAWLVNYLVRLRRKEGMQTQPDCI